VLLLVRLRLLSLHVRLRLLRLPLGILLSRGRLHQQKDENDCERRGVPRQVPVLRRAPRAAHAVDQAHSGEWSTFPCSTKAMLHGYGGAGKRESLSGVGLRKPRVQASARRLERAPGGSGASAGARSRTFDGLGEDREERRLPFLRAAAFLAMLLRDLCAQICVSAVFSAGLGRAKII